MLGPIGVDMMADYGIAHTFNVKTGSDYVEHNKNKVNCKICSTLCSPGDAIRGGFATFGLNWRSAYFCAECVARVKESEDRLQAAVDRSRVNEK